MAGHKQFNFIVVSKGFDGYVTDVGNIYFYFYYNYINLFCNKAIFTKFLGVLWIILFLL